MKNLTKLNVRELIEINGRSEISDAILYGAGAVIDTFINSQNRLRGIDSVNGDISSVADKYINV